MQYENCMKRINGGDYGWCEAQFACYEIIALIEF